MGKTRFCMGGHDSMVCHASMESPCIAISFSLHFYQGPRSYLKLTNSKRKQFRHQSTVISYRTRNFCMQEIFANFAIMMWFTKFNAHEYFHSKFKVVLEGFSQIIFGVRCVQTVETVKRIGGRWFLLYMSAQIIQAMSFTQLMVIWTPWITP